MFSKGIWVWGWWGGESLNKKKEMKDQEPENAKWREAGKATELAAKGV